MRGPCHSLTPCTASLARNPRVRRRPLRQTRGLSDAGRTDQLCSILRVHPVADDAEGGVAIEAESVHEIGNGAVHVAPASGTQAAEEGMQAAKRFAGALFHAVSS